MKKTLIITSLFLFAIATKVSAQLSLTVINNTGCSITITLYAHDAGTGAPCTTTGNCGDFVSKPFTIGPSNSQSFNTQLLVDDPLVCGPGNAASPGWVGGLCYLNACFPGSSPYGWDGAVITGTFTGSISVGGVAPCFSSTSGSSSFADDCNVLTVYAYWVVGSSQVTLTIQN